MNLDLVIQALRDRAALFAGRVSGAADFDAAFQASGGFTAPCAWVIPLDDTVEEESKTSSLMVLNERFGVFVMLDSSADLVGQVASNAVKMARNAIWQAILGLAVDELSEPIGYEGGALVKLDRARLFYRFEFSSDVTYGAEIGRDYADLVALPDANEMRLRMDMKDPAADPNAPPVTDPALGGYAGGYPGPDGRIEHEINIDLTTEG